MTERREKKPLLFVYGTLRGDSGHEMSRLLNRFASFRGEGSFRGRLFLIEDYPGAVPSKSPRDFVRGQLYSLRNPEGLLRRLDEYEECDPAHPESGLYRREVVDIEGPDGRIVPAWIYLYNRSTKGRRRISSGDFSEIAEATSDD